MFSTAQDVIMLFNGGWIDMMKKWLAILLILTQAACGVLPGAAPTPTPTLMVAPGLTVIPLPTQTNTPLPPEELTQAAQTALLFSAINLSAQVFSPSCEPKVVHFEVIPANPDIFSVALFYRVRYKSSGASTDWSSGLPMKTFDGKFVYDLTAASVNGFNMFKEPVAWVLYQFAATDRTGKVLGRSEVFNDKLTISSICP
jgi:hypothetical protein